MSNNKNGFTVKDGPRSLCSHPMGTKGFVSDQIKFYERLLEEFYLYCRAKNLNFCLDFSSNITAVIQHSLEEAGLDDQPYQWLVNKLADEITRDKDLCGSTFALFLSDSRRGRVLQ